MNNVVFLDKERISRDPEACERQNRAFDGVLRLAEEIGGEDRRAGLWLVLRASVLLYLWGRASRHLKDIRGLVDEWAAKTGDGA